MNKRASEPINYEIVLIIASIIVFSIIVTFVYKAATSSLYYEEVYAKKIGLSIEASVPGTILEFDISKLYEISKTNKFFKNNFESSFKEKFFYFNESDRSVRVKMADSGGFIFKLMSNRSVNNPTVDTIKKILVLQVGGSNE